MLGERIEIGPRGLSPARKRLAGIILFVSMLPSPCLATAYFITVVAFGSKRYGVLGAIVGVVLGLPTSFWITGIVTLIEFPITMFLLALVERPARRSRLASSADRSQTT